MDNEVLDIDEVMERVQDDSELLTELFEIFVEDFAEKRQSLNKMIENKEFENLKNIAHSMKGAASNISAKRVYACFAELEDTAENGEVDKIQGILKKIDEHYEELKKQIEIVKEKLKSS